MPASLRLVQEECAVTAATQSWNKIRRARTKREEARVTGKGWSCVYMGEVDGEGDLQWLHNNLLLPKKNKNIY